MSSAGQQLVAGRIPGERIATAIETADSATFTAVTEVISVDAPLVAGRVYRVTFDAALQSDTSGDVGAVRIVEDSDAGNVLQNRRVYIHGTSNLGFPARCEAEFTATTTGTKTFVGTGELVSGTGDIYMHGNANQPAYLYVDYIRG